MKCKVCGEEVRVLVRHNPLPNYLFSILYCEKCDIRWEVIRKKEVKQKT